jgi:hypothetical protein
VGWGVRSSTKVSGGFRFGTREESAVTNYTLLLILQLRGSVPWLDA